MKSTRRWLPVGSITTYCDVFEVAAGRIVGHRVYWDQMTVAIQLGLAPDPQTVG
jgi:limonene-1,2-epoxide hydrolase